LFEVVVRNGCETQCVVVADAIKWNTFVGVVGHLFGCEETKGEFVVGYVDEDGDHINVKSDEELMEAFLSLSLLNRNGTKKVDNEEKEQVEKVNEEEEQAKKEEKHRMKKEMKERMKKEKKEKKATMKNEKKAMKQEAKERKIEAKKGKKLWKLEKRNTFLTKKENQMQQRIERMQAVKANLEQRRREIQTQMSDGTAMTVRNNEEIGNATTTQAVCQGERGFDNHMEKLRGRREFLQRRIECLERVQTKSPKMIEMEMKLRYRLSFVMKKLNEMEQRSMTTTGNCQQGGGAVMATQGIQQHINRLEQRQQRLQEKLAHWAQQDDTLKKEKKEQKLQAHLRFVSEKLNQLKQNDNGQRRCCKGTNGRVTHLQIRRQMLVRQLEEVNHRLEYFGIHVEEA